MLYERKNINSRKFLIKPIAILFALLFFSEIIYSQRISLMEYKGEIGGAIGTASYIGQIGGGVKSFKPNLNLFYKKLLSENFSVRVNYEYVPLGADDNMSKQVSIKSRGFNFYRTFHELNFMFEYYFNNVKYLSSKSQINPYIGIGMGYLLNVPTDKNNFLTYATAQQKYTEQYWPICTLPFNFGLSYRLKNDINVFAECTFRLTTSDLIDNFSASDTISTNHGTFTANKSGNDKFFTIKIGMYKSLFNFYGIDRDKKRRK